MHAGMAQQLALKLVPLVTSIALLIAIGAPVTHWILAHRNLQRIASLYAGDLANSIRQIAQESPQLWKYQTYKFITITEGFHPSIAVSGFRILDDKGELISGHDYHPVKWMKPGTKLSFREDLKFTLGTAPILFNNRQVGMVEVLADDTPIVRASALLFSFSLLTGIALAVLVYRFPVKVVRKMEEQIGELIAELRQSAEEVRQLNGDLELKVEERTKELIDAREELVRREKLAILGQLSGSVGHELRNPLGVMSNAIYFLKMVNVDSDAKTKEYLDIIKQEIDNSQRIITDLLDFARTKTPQIRPIAIRELLDKSIGTCVIPATIDLQSEIPDSLPLLKIDPLQIEQVLQNLITNAVQAMPAGGTLRISAKKARGERQARGTRSEEQPLTPNLKPGFSDHDPDFIEISVTDNGEGMLPENMDKLFQPLFTTKAKGIGLGLVVCRNLVEANGGKIEVESLPGEGTTFTVMLPVVEE